MTKFIGRKNNQVSTNAQLGGMAFQDSSNAAVGNIDIESISGSPDVKGFDKNIYETATNVFVYDTSKDSDGGAWRKRTQNTSWYKETLNTATRGSRREFPSVAVIVCGTDGTNGYVHIYDGDDPDLPMWMVFTGNGALMWTTPNAVSALNGTIVVATPTYGVPRYDFIGDTIGRWRANTTYDGYKVPDRTIAGRDINTNISTVDGPPFNNNALSDDTCNDIAMTVLPNALIDDVTGLPIPTIAVATQARLSIITEGGQIVDLYVAVGAYDTVKKVSFTDDNKIAYTVDGETQSRAFRVDSIPGSDRAVTSNQLQKQNGEEFYVTRDYGVTAGDMAYSGIESSRVNSLVKRNVAHQIGLSKIEKEESGPRHAFVTSSFNTGWMYEDIKGAFLSDTDDTDLVDTNLVGNGTFDSNIDGWTLAGNATVTHDSGRLKMVSNSGNPLVYTAVTCEVGKRYYFQADFEGSMSFHASTQASSSGDVAYIPYGVYGSSTTKHCFFVATQTTMYLVPHVIGTGNTGYIDNVICKLADHDRSVYGSVKANVGGVNGISSGLAVYGTITNSAVATGAELVAYSGWSASNYLQQPYNSDLAPGTGAYSVMCWFKTGTSTSDQYIFDRSSGGGGSRNLLLIMHSNAGGGSANKLQWWHRNSSGNYTDIQITDKAVTDNAWHQVVALYDGSTYMVYVDGIASSVTSSVGRDVGNDGGPAMYIGVRHSLASPMLGSLALFRYSKSAPSAEDVRKIYEDEKHLFVENAKATLYGSSDVVTALAYDEETNLLHAGTSSGRSDFQGLCRINNTTTAVTTAISAHDGLIAQQ